MKISIIVIPNSNFPEVIRINKSSYRVRVDAPAVENKANKRLIEILSEYFDVSKYSIKILKGLKNRNKIVNIDNL